MMTSAKKKPNLVLSIDCVRTPFGDKPPPALEISAPAPTSLITLQSASCRHLSWRRNQRSSNQTPHDQWEGGSIQ